MKNIVIKIIVLLLLIILMLSLCSCKNLKFDPDNLIGKTSAEIEEEFGKFDCLLDSESDGLYRNCKCGYTIKARSPGFLSAYEERLLFIHFDYDGKAYKFSIGYRLGG